MRIDEIHIYGFGKFKDYKLNFADGFNLIYGENENGKTTIAEFIKMMFYGSRPRITDVFKNPRTKYRPLDGGTMAGSITFFHQGTRYRLEREFRNSNATDKITLYNLDLGDSTTLSGKDDIGAMFFGLNFGAFEKSVFIGNSVYFGADAEADGDINSRLSNMTNSGDEDISYEAVVKRITAAMEEIKTKTGRGGALVRLNAALDELNEDFAAQKELIKKKDELEAEIEKKTLLCDEISAKKRECFERLKAAEKFEIKTKLEEFIKVATDYEKKEKSVTLTNGNIADKQFCDDLALIIAKAEKIAEKCDTLSGEIARLTDEVAVLEESAANTKTAQELNRELNEINEQCENHERQKDKLELDILLINEKITASKPKINIPLIVIGAVLCIVSAFVGALLSPIVFAGAALGVILVVLAFILKIKPNTEEFKNQAILLNKQLENINNELSVLRQKGENLKLKINDMAVKAATGESIITEKRAQIISRRTELLEAQNESAATASKMISLCCTLKPVSNIAEAKALLSGTCELLEELGRLRVAAEYAAKGTNCKNLAEATEKLALIVSSDNAPTATLEEIRQELKEITDEHAAASKELAVLKAEARSSFSGLKVPAELEREKRELLEQINEQNEYFDDLSLALEGLTAAFGEVRRSFSGVLETRALELLSGITNGKYNAINVSKNFDITVADRDNFGSHGLEYLSKGAMHQAYFSLRLALSELMGKDSGGLPVILDDAFSQYDDTRLLKALEFLKQYSNTAQVIFFTCHNDCKQTAKNAGAEIINL